MKQADVKIGGQYMTRVSGGMVRVEVIGTREKYGFGKRKCFVCKRVNYNHPALDGSVLPKARTAAALHPTGDE